MTPHPLIEAQGLGYTPPRPKGLLERWARGRAASAPARPTVVDVDLRLAPGERLGLVGRSGSGKTTLARLLAGLLVPDRGTLRWSGRDIGRLSRRARRRIAIEHVQVLHQDPYAVLNPAMCAREVVEESVRAREHLTGARLEARTTALLERVGLAHLGRRAVTRLSGGERRKITLACALAAPPRLLVVDEPTAGLDPIARAEVVELLDDMARLNRMALLVIAHDLDGVRRLCPRLGVVDEGRLCEWLPAGARAAVTAPARSLLAADGAERHRHRGSVTLEYLTFLGVGTLLIGLAIWMFGGTLRTWFDFARWWWSNPVF